MNETNIPHNNSALPGENAMPSLAVFEKKIGYAFHDSTRLRRALTHSSSTADKREDNERLEFFGDAVLDFIVCEHLFHALPFRSEGDLTEVKSALVRRRTLAKAARRLDVRPHLILGRGIAQRHTLPSSIFANVYEAIVAAIYLDGGLEEARIFVQNSLADDLKEAEQLRHALNYKSILQQQIQQENQAVPNYVVVSESGPDHDKVFEVAVQIHEAERGRGRGASKKEAEQEAAREALHAMGYLDDNDKEQCAP